MVDSATKLPLKTTGESKGKSVPSRAWHPFESLRSEIDRLFDEFPFPRGLPMARGGLFGQLLPSDGGMIEPAFEIASGDKAYVVTAELPGLDPKDVEISVADGMLCVRGEKKEEKEETKKNYFLSERRYGSFSRSFRLPDGTDEGKIEAAMKQGLLTVTLPKSDQAKQKDRKIPIKA